MSDVDPIHIAFENGWRAAANWANREDLVSDIGSAPYIADQNEALTASVDAWRRRSLRLGFAYVRESDDHYVVCTQEQAANLIRDLLGFDVRFLPPDEPAAKEAQPDRVSAIRAEIDLFLLHHPNGSFSLQAPDGDCVEFNADTLRSLIGEQTASPTAEMLPLPDPEAWPDMSTPMHEAYSAKQMRERDRLWLERLQIAERDKATLIALLQRSHAVDHVAAEPEPKGRLEVLERNVVRLSATLKHLTVMARTSGGTAGSDPALMSACRQGEEVIAAVGKQDL